MWFFVMPSVIINKFNTKYILTGGSGWGSHLFWRKIMKSLILVIHISASDTIEQRIVLIAS